MLNMDFLLLFLKAENNKMRYTRYDDGAIHWREYTKEGYYMKNVDDALLHFEDIERGTVLDIGCGDGLPACKLAEMGFKVIGVDNEPKGIELAKKMCKVPVQWICQNIVEFEKENKEWFDYMLSLDVIEHLEDPEVVVRLMDRVTKFAILITDDKQCRKELGQFHLREYLREEIMEMFKGFKMEEIPIQDNRFFGYKIWAKK